ncbi:hypothetical protein [uncultured Erythrobacter sp.]|uniref:hypothetical protein n=1 Tax=uncultured Erythrobacter sp. TaxID=263913 RepID=UPI0026097026|nr:hypothetical protein [uncultured Erythrobacter sp.]
MFPLTKDELEELESCKRSLQGVLVTLDTAGAGIAAIHVNAAIEQLDSNLRALRSSIAPEKPAFLFPEHND